MVKFHCMFVQVKPYIFCSIHKIWLIFFNMRLHFSGHLQYEFTPIQIFLLGVETIRDYASCSTHKVFELKLMIYAFICLPYECCRTDTF